MVFDLFKPLELPPQLQWGYAHEPALMEWTIRAHNYNVFAANLVCAVLALMVLSFTYFLYWDTSRTTGAILSFLSISFGFCMFHQRMNTAYRFTKSGVECCEWKYPPKWILPFLKRLTGFTIILFLFLATIDPTFLIGALLGPGGMALTYLGMANSKSMQAIQTQYHHNSIKWENISRLSIAPNREVVGLRYCFRRKDSELIRYWSLNIFCKRKEKKKVAEIIRPLLLPDTPCVVAKVNIPPRGEL